MSCTVCCELFYEPVTLTCQHTYCRACLVSWLEGQAESAQRLQDDEQSNDIGSMCLCPSGCTIPRRLPGGVNAVLHAQCRLRYPARFEERRAEMEPLEAEIAARSESINRVRSVSKVSARSVARPPAMQVHPAWRASRRPAGLPAHPSAHAASPRRPSRALKGRASPAAETPRRPRPSELVRVVRDFGVALAAFIVFPLLPLLLALLMRAYYFAPGLDAVKPPPLYVAAQVNRASLVRELLEAGVPPDAGKCLDAFGTTAFGQLTTRLPYVAWGCAVSETPLYAAAAAGQYAAAEALLRGGASVHRGLRRLFAVRTPVLAAAEAGEGELVRLLLHHGARLSSCRSARLCVSANARRRSALVKSVIRRMRLRPVVRVSWHLMRGLAEFMWGGALAVLFGPFSFLWLIWKPSRDQADEVEFSRTFLGSGL